MKNRSLFSQFAFIIRYCGRIYWQTDKRAFILNILLNSVNSITIFPNVLLDKWFIDTLVANLGNATPGVYQTIFTIIAMRFGLAALRTLSGRLSGFYGRMMWIKLSKKMEIDVGLKYATISVPTLEDPKFKDRYQKVERESINRVLRVYDSFVRLPQYVIGIISSLSIFVISQPWIAALALASLLPSIMVDRYFIKKAYDLDTAITLLHRIRGMYSHYLGRTRSYLESRLLNAHSYLAEKIGGLWDQVGDKRLALEKGRRTGGYAAGLIDDAVSYGMDGIFALQTISGQITLGTAQAFIRAISNFKQNVTSLTVAVLDLYENYLYISDLVWFLGLESPYISDSGSKFPQSISRGITFKNVWFKYPGSEKWILQGLSFHIKPNENIAIVGKNGAGKTTLVKLLCGFYEPVRGEITIDGVKIADLNKTDYWRNLSILFQDFENYGFTARESVGISNIAQIDDLEKIRKYARLSDIDSWIESLPRKYQNPLTRDFEHGVNPSSGQAQRLGIARTLFKDPQILVLDEPTSNVDPEAEEKIFEEVLSTGLKKIIVFISHRFSTVRKADKIILMQDGKAKELGSHKELMALGGEYSKLFNLQAKSYR